MTKRPTYSGRTSRPPLAPSAETAETWLDADFAELQDVPEPYDMAAPELAAAVLPGAVADPVARVFDFAERVKAAPDRPGCYLMIDRNGAICYVGKATSLRNRLRQYASGQDERFFVQLLGRVLGDLEFVITPTEKDALLLENELIKKHLPRFNVRLKDDKRFLHLRLDSNQDYPRLQVVRRPAQDKAQYFGPYASASSARATLAQINRYFQLRTCPDSAFKNRTRPCLEYQIHRCLGPCVLPVDVATYHQQVRDVALFLSGRRSELLGRLKKRMADAAEAEEFERAGRHRDQLQAIETSLEQQHVSLLGRRKSIDAVGLYREGAKIAVTVLTFREGVLLGSQGYVLRDQEFPDAEVLEGFLLQLYERGQPVPDELLLPMAIDGEEALAEWLTDQRKVRAALTGETASRSQVEIRDPQRGLLSKLVEMAVANAKQTFEDRVRASAKASSTLLGLQKKLHLTRLPRRIECYDISNISGTDPVGSMVVFLDGEPANQQYRRYKIRAQETPNDFAMMYEVLSRRMARAMDGRSPWPDLIVIDGGKGQLSMALAALADLGAEGVELCGLAKARTQESDDSEHSASSPERVFRPGVKNAIVMPQNSNEVYLLTRLRDEAHRFAIAFHRERRDKRVLTSWLDKIVGLGPAKKKTLLLAFGSLTAIKEANEASLANVVGPGLARRIAVVTGTMGRVGQSAGTGERQTEGTDD